MKMIINADPHIDYIPKKLMDWALKHVIGVFLKHINSKAKKLPEEYLNLIKEKEDYYAELMRRVSKLEEITKS